MKFSVKKGDNVLVLSGKDKGKQGEVLEIDRENRRVKVANVNIQSHHKKPRNKDDKGGILKTEGAIDISNVQVVCPTCKKATRVAHSLVDGKSVRVCKKCGASLDVAKKAVKKTASKPKAEKVEKPAEVKPAKAEKPAKPATSAEKPATKPTTTAAKSATKAAKPAAKKAEKPAEKPATKAEKSTTKTSKPVDKKSVKAKA